jgi:RNA polymerase sigma-70 factor, ECF subfamily
MTTNEFQYNLINLQESLLRYAYSLTSDKDDAKDLLQDTILKTLKYCDKFVHDFNFKAWTYTIMKNTFINNYRRSIRKKYFSDQPKDWSYLFSTQPSNFHEPDTEYISKELEKTIEALDDNFKLPFKMHMNGFKYKEIAKSLDLNLGTVKSRIFFARKKLMKLVNN